MFSKMKFSLYFLLCYSAFYAGARKNSSENAILTIPTAEEILGTALEKLLGRLDSMDSKLLELQNELTKHSKEVKKNRVFHENAIHRLELDVGTNLSVILDQQTTCANHLSYEALEQAWLFFKSRTADCVSITSTTSPATTTTTTTTTTPRTTTTTSQPTTTLDPKSPSYTSCKNVPSKVSGVYIIQLAKGERFNVFCEQTNFGGGWIVVQHRFDGTIDFNRNWTQYRDGFGVLDKEFWLGLEKVHQLTTARTHELIVEVKDFSGNYGYARYSAFQVGSESEQYVLKSLGSYSGTAGDSLTRSHKGAKFSTIDRDNDPTPDFQFAVYNHGAWWYGDANASNLNGPYKNTFEKESIWWWTFKNKYQGLSYTRMMIREL